MSDSNSKDNKKDSAIEKIEGIHFSISSPEEIRKNTHFPLVNNFNETCNPLDAEKNAHTLHLWNTLSKLTYVRASSIIFDKEKITKEDE